MARNELTAPPAEAVKAIETALSECSPAALAGLSPIARTLQLARGMDALRRNLAGPLLENILALKDTPLGYVTDRKPGTTDDIGKATRKLLAKVYARLSGSMWAMEAANEDEQVEAAANETQDVDAS